MRAPIPPPPRDEVQGGGQAASRRTVLAAAALAAPAIALSVATPARAASANATITLTTPGDPQPLNTDIGAKIYATVKSAGGSLLPGEKVFFTFPTAANVNGKQYFDAVTGADGRAYLTGFTITEADTFTIRATLYTPNITATGTITGAAATVETLPTGSFTLEQGAQSPSVTIYSSALPKLTGIMTVTAPTGTMIVAAASNIGAISTISGDGKRATFTRATWMGGAASLYVTLKAGASATPGTYSNGTTAIVDDNGATIARGALAVVISEKQNNPGTPGTIRFTTSDQEIHGLGVSRLIQGTYTNDSNGQPPSQVFWTGIPDASVFPSSPISYANGSFSFYLSSQESSLLMSYQKNTGYLKAVYEGGSASTSQISITVYRK